MKLGFEIDKQLVDDGDWVPLDQLQPGFRVKLRSMRCAAYRRACDRRLRALRDDRTLTARKRKELSDRAYLQAMADTIVITWEGLRDAETGDAIPYSRELATEFLTEEKYVLFQNAVTMASQNVGMPTIDLLDDDEEPDEKAEGPEALQGNSVRGSASGSKRAPSTPN